MGNGNSAHWIAEARKNGLNLDFLVQDKAKMYRDLEDIGLPTCDDNIFMPGEVTDEIIETLFARSTYFCRMIDAKTGARDYRLILSNMNEFEIFYDEKDKENTIVHLIEKKETIFTGSIRVSYGMEGMSCIAELVEGDGPGLFHGHETPLNVVSEFGRSLKFTNRDPTRIERKIITSAVRMIGGSRNPFPGYFEYEVWPEGEIMFRNYQGPASAYAKE